MNMRLQRVFLTLVIAITVVGFSAATGTIPDDFQVQNSNGFVFAWRIVGTNLEVIMEQTTTGWIAVGFEPSRVMKDANIIIGYVAGEQVVAEDHFGHRLTAHRPDTDQGGTNDVTVISGAEDDGTTRIRFRIPLDSGDDADQPLVRGTSVTVIYAWGRDRSDNTTSLHSGRGSMTVTL